MTQTRFSRLQNDISFLSEIIFNNENLLYFFKIFNNTSLIFSHFFLSISHGAYVKVKGTPFTKSH